MKRWARRAITVLALAFVVAVAGYLAREPLLRRVGQQIVHADPLAKSDAIVVLAGGELDRELEAADIYRAGWAQRVLMTVEEESEAADEIRRRGVRLDSVLDRRRRVLVELGVPPGSITTLPGPVRSTEQESRVLADWAAESRARRVIIVTSSFHTGRARYIFRRTLEGTGIEVLVRPASLSSFQTEDWWRQRDTLREGLMELQKLLVYRVLY